MEIIRENEVETQEDLARHLNEAGYSVTQATVSRDIREMSLIKVPGIRVKQRYTVSTEGGGGGSSGIPVCCRMVWYPWNRRETCWWSRLSAGWRWQ